MRSIEKNMRFLSMFFVASAILFFVYQMNENSGTLKGYSHLIGVSLPNASVSHNVNLIRRINTEEKAEEDVNILVKEAQDNAGQQLKDIIDLENHGIDLLVISPITDEKIFKKLKEIKIPVIVLHNRKAIEYASAFIEYDNKKAGELLANSIKFANEEKENILILSGIPEESITTEREAGFLSHLPEPLKEKVDKIYCGWRRNEAENQLKAYLVSGKKVSTVVALSNQMAYGAYLGVSKLREENIRIYGMDGFSLGKDASDTSKMKILNNTVKFDDLYASMMKVSLAILHGDLYEEETILRASLEKKEG